jgi:hypothetical protein
LSIYHLVIHFASLTLGRKSTKTRQAGLPVSAFMFGAVLRAITAPLVAEPGKPPVTPHEFVGLIEQAQEMAGLLNNTNAWELASAQPR